MHGLVCHIGKRALVGILLHLIRDPRLHIGCNEFSHVQLRLVVVRKVWCKVLPQVKTRADAMRKVVVECVVKAKKAVKPAAGGRAAPAGHAQVVLAVGTGEEK